jgi:peptidoglycan hydrolase FlgJ
MISQTDLSGKLAFDTKGLNELRQSAKNNSPEALKAAAKQFEALFMNMMLKSMRQATPQDGIFDSEQSRMYTSMLDQQLSQNLASRGVGLADVLIRQLSSTVERQALDMKDGQSLLLTNPPVIPTVKKKVEEPATKSAPLSSLPAHVQAFQARLASHAEEASRVTGIPAKFMLGQAALESGWGKKEIVAADGTHSHNLFGIKATGGWKGKVVEAATTEYVNGVAHKKVEKFRAYDSYTDAFRDYGNLLRNNPRYQNVMASANDLTAFAQGLQRAGYATDPKYAEKLTRLIKQSLTA